VRRLGCLHVHAIFIGETLMIEFNTYIARHGDIGVQALIEKLERYDGVRPQLSASLEERWKVVVSSAQAGWQAAA
jgi:hypothetical protein